MSLPTLTDGAEVHSGCAPAASDWLLTARSKKISQLQKVSLWLERGFLLLQAHCSDFLSSNAHEQLLNKCLDDIKFKEKKWWPSPSPESSQIWSLYKVVLNWKTNKFNFSETTQVLASLYTDSLVVLKLTCDVRVSHKTTCEDNEPYTTGCGMIWSAEGSEKLWMK